MDTSSSLAIQNLFSYVEENNVPAIKAHLDKFKEVDSRSENGQTLLMMASEQGSLEMVQELLRRGANVNLDDVDCWTALISAAKEGHVEVVKELLANNASLEHRDMVGEWVWGLSEGLSGWLTGGAQRDEMKNFAGQQIEPLFQFSWLVVFLTLLLCGSVALVLGFTVTHRLAIAVSLSLLALLYVFFVLVYYGGHREGENWNWAWLLSTRLARQVGYLELLLKLMFVNPPELPEQTTRALPVRFLFTDYNRLSSVGGETSMAEMIATLSDACEREFGFMATRLFRVFKNEENQGKKWKKTCCVPSFMLFVVTLGCLITAMALLAIFKVQHDNLTLNAVLIAMASVVGLALLLNCRTWWQVADSVLNSQRKRLHSAANKMHKLKSEGFMKVLKQEVELMSKMAKTIDGFTQNQTRMTVIIDGLDACEQDKVLQMLDTVRVLFSKGPFISIFASDPHIIIKAINQNLNSVLRDSNINGHDYMRNIVHLPVFLNSRSLSTTRKLCMAAPTPNGDLVNPEGWHEEMDRKLSLNSLGDQAKFGSKTALNRRDTYRRRQIQRTVTRQMSFDLTKLLVTEDWFSDISPQTMRRLLNIVSVTGRLLRANHIIFNWDRLASWINMTEEWPYRTSWLILFLEETDGISDQVTLKTIYERISKNIPTTKDVEPLLEIDGDIRSFEVFLSSRTPVLMARDVEMFLPCTVNLDPKLREIIADVRAAREQMHIGGVAYPTLPLQDVPARAPSSFGQHSAACSPTGSYVGSLPPPGLVPPQPHSSYYSMPAPQHPFYTRPYFPNHVYHLPRHQYSSHLHPAPTQSRPSFKTGYPRDPNGLDVIAEDPREGLPSPTTTDPPMGSASGVSGTPVVLLSSLNTDAVCERVKQIAGMDSSMLGQYTATIKKANVNGRVLSQCNLEELKNEMSMNFGDWQLFRGMVMEQRNVEGQALQDESRAASEQGSSVVNMETARHQGQGAPHEVGDYILNLSFEELSNMGLSLEEPTQTHRETTQHWPMTATHHTPSMSSLNLQESSNDICKLTDKQQAEYRDAYREYIAQMTQLDVAGGGGEKSVQPHLGQFLQYRDARNPEENAKDGSEKDVRKPSFPTKRGAKATDVVDTDVPLDPISEEDEKLDASKAGSSKVKGPGPRYHKVPSNEEEGSGPEESENTPLLNNGGAQAPSNIALNKDSSDSGVRSGESSSDHSLEEVLVEAEEEGVNKLELESLVKKRGLLPGSLSGLQDSTITRMSICSEAPSEGSPMASSPDETWFRSSSSVSNLNRTPSTTTLNNNRNSSNNAATNNTSQDNQDTESSTPVLITPGSSTGSTSTTRPVHNQNLCGIIHKRPLGTGETLKVCTGAPDAIFLEDERESVL
ncbi:kinase D-interacting substrate of 220 kDa B-like [Oncorhynchus masou masou]|uniref:kinase D-interacting substrate of 220 kDa B-like n=1 Tax=Oncorhynchus masou masou TaxID=90313 RepID=UPI003183D67F